MSAGSFLYLLSIPWVTCEADTCLANSDARPRAALRCICMGMCFWSSVYAPILSPHSFGSVFLSHTLSLPPLGLSTASCSHHCWARADPLSSRRREPTAGAGGVHRAPPGCDAISFGDHVRLDFIFGPPCFSKVGLGHCLLRTVSI